MKIGNLSIESTAALAPMAGVADPAFRLTCKKFGAAYLVSEMASCKALTYHDQKTRRLLTLTESEHPIAIQLFGDDPQTMADAAKLALEFSPDILDLNMGCPAPKITSGGAGSALMKTPLKAAAIIEAVVKAVPIPVTVKFRKGWDEESINAVEFAQMAEKSGAAALTVHGRTRKQMYSGKSDLSVIRDIKQSVSIPVIGNGDITLAEDALEMYRKTGCDLVMVGRGALGAPWLFSQIRAAVLGNEPVLEPSMQEKMKIMKEHIALLCELRGEREGMREARKHVIWYFKGLRGAAAFRRKASLLSSFDQLEAMIDEALNNLETENGDL